jgi:hypothetical protein
MLMCGIAAEPNPPSVAACFVSGLGACALADVLNVSMAELGAAVDAEPAGVSLAACSTASTSARSAAGDRLMVWADPVTRGGYQCVPTSKR